MWINRRFLICFLASILSGHALSSNLDCQFNLLSIEPLSAKSTYDVFFTGGMPLIQNYQIRAEITGQECAIDVELDIDQGAKVLRRSGSKEMKLEWHGNAGYEKAGRWYISLSELNETARFQIRYPPNQWLTAGHFTGQLHASFSGPNANLAQQEQQLTYDVSVSVLPSAKIQFYGLSQRHYELNIGDLTKNKTVQPGPKLWVQSTGGYSITVESINRGVLRHQSENSQWDIAYQLTLENQNIDLNQSIDQWFSQHSTSGKPIPMTFLVGDTKNKPSGRYHDTVNISIQPELTQQP
ncbi:hypothetical protein [Vibrio tapetis]|uniref:Secreted protein n=1 Tax=Vibrio tapetis subsp. tapetis TaxID=1671868 RepID=A0A2N8ZKG1_9VIBR|nr:hypothetical protein [Vibrio tapetis]SON52399.1 conserved exported protein of unknown function [Vibrio tapetis subsp. tapetis]